MPERIGPIRLTRPIIAGVSVAFLLVFVVLVTTIAGGGSTKAEKSAGPVGAAAATAPANVDGCISALPEDQAPPPLGMEAQLYGPGASDDAAAKAAVAASCSYFAAVKQGDSKSLYVALSDEWRSNLTSEQFAIQLKQESGPRYHQGVTTTLLPPGMTVVSKDSSTFGYGRTKSTYTSGPLTITEFAEVVWKNSGRGWQLVTWDPAYDVRIDRGGQYRPAPLNSIEDREVVLTDTNRQTSVVAQFNPGMPSGGKFVFAVPDLGWFRAGVPGVITSTADGSYRLNFKGTGTLTRSKDAVGLPGGGFETWSPSEPVAFELDIDSSPKAEEAWAILKVENGSTYLVETRKPVSSPRATAEQVLAAVKTLDFASVSKLRAKGSSASEQAFLSAQAEVQQRWPKAVDVGLATGAVYVYTEKHAEKEYWRTHDDDEVRVTYGLTFAHSAPSAPGKPNTMVVYGGELTLTLEGGVWKVLVFPAPRLTGGLVKPELRCQGTFPDGRPFLRWGVTNTAGYPVTIPVGAANGFDPVPLDRGQWATFPPGKSQSFDFEVAPAKPTTWTLNDQKATGTAGAGTTCS